LIHNCKPPVPAAGQAFQYCQQEQACCTTGMHCCYRPPPMRSWPCTVTCTIHTQPAVTRSLPTNMIIQ
jgi:hypothetical protein